MVREKAAIKEQRSDENFIIEPRNSSATMLPHRSSEAALNTRRYIAKLFLGMMTVVVFFLRV